jgi:hypothetical protein
MDGYCAADLRHLHRVSETSAVKIAFANSEHLRLSLQAPECSGVNNPSPVSVHFRQRITFPGTLSFYALCPNLASVTHGSQDLSH